MHLCTCSALYYLAQKTIYLLSSISSYSTSSLVCAMGFVLQRYSADNEPQCKLVDNLYILCFWIRIGSHMFFFHYPTPYDSMHLNTL
jgi:hypothetical protein